MAYATQPTDDKKVTNVIRLEQISDGAIAVKGAFQKNPIHPHFQVRNLQGDIDTVDFVTAAENIAVLMNGVTPERESTSMEFRYVVRGAQIILRAKDINGGMTKDVLSVTQLGKLDFPLGFGQKLADIYDVSDRSVDRSSKPAPA